MTYGKHVVLLSCMRTRPYVSRGYGAILGQHWFFGPFTDTWQSFNITFLELFSIALEVRLWSRHMSNRCIVFVTDNAALVSIINQEISKHRLVMIGAFTRHSFWVRHSQILARGRIVFGTVRLIYTAKYVRVFSMLISGTAPLKQQRRS